ncbi:hypothetical protein [Staphylothermus hellenicus]|nr:hypothetical protein [Staphylothermus hellenicus]
MLKIIVSKTADLLAKLYDMFNAPNTYENLPVHVLSINGLSETFYYGYVFDKENLWDKLFDVLINKQQDNMVKHYLSLLDKINIYNWKLIEKELEVFSGKFKETYSSYRSKINKFLGKILRINKFFKEEYMILSFNPFKELIGAVPRINIDLEYAVITLFVRPDSNPLKALDLYLHELIHGLLRLNNIRIREDVEEEFIDTLCPEGYLSKELGLSNTVNVNEGNLQAYIASYFEEKLYEKIDLLSYLERRGSVHYI